MSKFKINTHTVILLVGPSGCGKTYFSKNHLIPNIKAAFEGLPSWRKPNIQYISSDAIRRELLGNDMSYEKFTENQRMMEVSEQAFELLYKKLELAMTYPVSAEAVIVDTTGMNEIFRSRVLKIVDDAHYNTACIVFLYRDRNEYFKYLEDPDMKLITTHINRLRRKTMSEIKRKDFDSFLSIKQKDFTDISIEVVDAEEYVSYFLPEGSEYCLIGDVHGNKTLLIKLLERLGFVIKDDLIVETPWNKVPIILGDYIDGIEGDSNIIDTITFLFANRHHFKFIMGNHEHFMHRFQEGNMESLPPEDFLKTWFPTLDILDKVSHLLNALFVQTKPFYIGVNFIATHSPCEDKYLSKLDSISRRKMRNHRYPQRDEDESIDAYSKRIEESLLYLKKEAASSKSFHVFGHCPFKNPLRIKNKIGVDTGVSRGGKLTAVAIAGRKLFFYSVEPKEETKLEIPEIFSKKVREIPEVNFDLLDSREISRIKYAAKDKVNYISGTMSPSAPDYEKGILESVDKALDYFQDQGVTKLCLQPKYMGSRSEVFLDCKDISQSYSTTRRGYPIKRVDLEKAYKGIFETLDTSIKEGCDWVLLDAELMPWHALGEGLIKSQYEPVYEGLKSELALLKETGFEKQLSALYDEYTESKYNKLSSQMSKDKLKKIIPSHKCASYSSIQDFLWIPLEEQDRYFSIYSEQLKIFASPSEPHFKPFSILKSGKGATEKLYFDGYTNEELFNLVSEDQCLGIDLDDPQALTLANEFFAEIVAKNLEGVVIKPQQIYIKGVAPYMKVRNPNYLSIIYGYDYFFEPKYRRLLKQKRIGRKLQASIDEFEYGKMMLEIPRNEIATDNVLYNSLVAKLILEEKKEVFFDPRL